MKLKLPTLPSKTKTLQLPKRHWIPRKSVHNFLHTDRLFASRKAAATPVEITETEVDSREKKIKENSKRPIVNIGPQPGKQMAAASCTADILLYGGQAGGGKTYFLILEDLPHIHLSGFVSVTFRRTLKEIKLAGGLWDKSTELYRSLGAKSNSSSYEHIWPSGARSTFAGLEHEQDKFSYQGGQIALLKFDELPHFTSGQFWYMLSRNRSTCGIIPYVRATCNPEPNSWVFNELIWWWIGDDGFPIKERDGVLRWFCRLGDEMIWADSKEELLAMKPAELSANEWYPKSISFISASLHDNPALTTVDPGYESNLAALPAYERALLKEGNWKTKPAKGMRFRRDWFEIVDTVPELTNISRYWDRAGTEPSPLNANPDATAGVKGGTGPGNIVYITDLRHFKKTAGVVENEIAKTSREDGCHLGNCQLWLEQDPAQAGKVERHHLSVNLDRYAPRFIAPTGNRYVRSGPASSAAEMGRIKLLRGSWNELFLREVDNFIDERVIKPPTGYHDDITTAFVGLYERLMIAISSSGPRVY